MDRAVKLLDTTFRDGIQAEGVEVTNLDDALKAIQAIDALGVAYLELGFALANEAARQRIKAALKLPLRAKVAAFGRTHPSDVQAILDLQVPVGVLVGKTRRRDVEKSLHLTSEENLKVIFDSVRALVSQGLEVIFDAEHFFQAYFEDDRQYALTVLATALNAGAIFVTLCDTNGKMTPEKTREAIWGVAGHGVPLWQLGIHTHNDRGRAIANAEAAYQCGVRHFQGTTSGVGERVGNMDLLTLVANLASDFGEQSFSPEELSRLRFTYLLVCDVLNISPQGHLPWVGHSAFFTSAGMHASGELRDQGSYFHAEPAMVGNQARIGVTDQSGRANILLKAKELGLTIPDDQLASIAKKHQALVDGGANFGSADASFHLFLLRETGQAPNFFQFSSFRVAETKEVNQPIQSEAILRLSIGSHQVLNVANGAGPVNALDSVLRKTILPHYPILEKVRLTDFKVRIVDAGKGTAAKVRVLIDFTDGVKTWTTMAVYENLIEASWEALCDGYIYDLATRQ